jgi:hypothetical protein
LEHARQVELNRSFDVACQAVVGQIKLEHAVKLVARVARVPGA